MDTEPPGRLLRARASRYACVAACWTIALVVPEVRAQINVPPVSVPDLPVKLPVDVNDPLAGGGVRLDPHDLRNVRLLRIQRLLRQNREIVEPDPNGAPMVRSEVLAFSPSDGALEAARAAGFRVVRERELEGLESRIVVLRAPDRMSTRRALKKLRSLDPQGAYDFNHLYQESGEVRGHPEMRRESRFGAAEPIAAGGSTVPALKIGLIDGGVDTKHPVFGGIEIRTRGCNGQPVVSGHGTAVASLLVGRSQELNGSARGAVLYAADVYCGVPIGGSVDAIADAFAWLARERVPAINVSLVGPPNILLERTVRAMIARGHAVVAAVGNDGPAAPPLYPASYPDVVGVTGVDAKRKVLVEACRGPQVDFAAPGADMIAAGSGGSYSNVRGTSFAAPIVAGMIATHLADVAPAMSTDAISYLAREAVDLGSQGPDRTYGRGLVGEALRSSSTASPAVPGGNIK